MTWWRAPSKGSQPKCNCHNVPGLQTRSHSSEASHIQQQIQICNLQHLTEINRNSAARWSRTIVAIESPSGFGLPADRSDPWKSFKWRPAWPRPASTSTALSFSDAAELIPRLLRHPTESHVPSEPRQLPITAWIRLSQGGLMSPLNGADFRLLARQNFES